MQITLYSSIPGAHVLIIHCVNDPPCTSFPLWEITAHSDLIEKSNIINEAWGLFFRESALSLSLCWLSVVSYTVIHFNGLHAWKCKTSRNGEIGGLQEQKWRELQGFLILPHLPLFIFFLKSPPRSFFRCFSDSLSASFALYFSLSLSFHVVNNRSLPPNTVPAQ